MNVLVAILLIFISTYSLVHLISFVYSMSVTNIGDSTFANDAGKGLQASSSKIQLFRSRLLTSSFKNNSWWLWILVSAVLTQLIVVSSWGDFKYVSIVTIAVIIISLIGINSWSFENEFIEDFGDSLARTDKLVPEILTESDLEVLPMLVQNYLRISGAVGRPKVVNMRVKFNGQMRKKNSDWFDFKSEQYNFFDIPQRNFFMKGSFKHIPTWAYHAYENGKASMTIKALSTIPVVSLDKNRQLDKSETVMLFNDMCILAPASLIDRRIKWSVIDDKSVQATFRNNGINISAKLYFNNQGQLINFISEDRYIDNERTRFSTPLSDYNLVDGYRVPTKGIATWHYLDGPFAYGVFNLNAVEYNVRSEKIQA